MDGSLPQIGRYFKEHDTSFQKHPPSYHSGHFIVAQSSHLPVQRPHDFLQWASMYPGFLEHSPTFDQ